MAGERGGAGSAGRGEGGGGRAFHLWAPLAIGATLRLLAAVVSDPTPGDDAGRLAAACRWAEHPQWLGLSGVWSPLHAYLLGGLIRLFGSPIFAARALGFVSTTA